jgi:hypothetical protein
MSVKFLLTIIIGAVLVFGSCKKDKRISNKIDGSTFYMWDLTIDGQTPIDYDTLRFHECKIYKDLCTGSWNRNGGESSFYWQINEKGTEMVISNNQTLEFTPANSKDYNAIDQCYKLSGKYEIVKLDKDGRHLDIYVKSLVTKGYPGVEVSFTLMSISE